MNNKFLIALALAANGFFSSASAELDLSNLPLFVQEGVPPNIVYTLDNSGSMAFAHDSQGALPGQGRADSMVTRV